MILRRLVLTIPIVLGVTFITFVVVNTTGRPLAQIELNPRVKPEDIERIRHNLGLDRPVQERYFTWLWNLAQGDLGYSMINGREVEDRILEALPNTLLLS